MEPKWIDLLSEQSQSKAPMKTLTIRIPPDIDSQMNDFCATNKIRKSVLLRFCAELGWKLLNASKR